MPGRGDGEDKGRERKQAHQVSGPERRLLYLDGTEARPGLPEPVLNPKGHGGSEALIGGSAAGPSRAAAPVGADMGGEQGGGRKTSRETTVVVQVRQWWLGTQEVERSRCVPENDFGSRINKASTGLDVGVLGGRRNQDVRLV